MVAWSMMTACNPVPCAARARPGKSACGRLLNKRFHLRNLSPSFAVYSGTSSKTAAMSTTSQSLLAELDSALVEAPAPWRRVALRRIIDLFRSGAQSYTGEQLELFDEVIGRLIKSTDRALLAETSKSLAMLQAGPIKVLGTLARHSDLTVCGPILEEAVALPDEDLIAIADTSRLDFSPKSPTGRSSAKRSPIFSSSAAPRRSSARSSTT
jgi:hypothetical protein